MYEDRAAPFNLDYRTRRLHRRKRRLPVLSNAASADGRPVISPSRLFSRLLTFQKGAAGTQAGTDNIKERLYSGGLTRVLVGYEP